MTTKNTSALYHAVTSSPEIRPWTGPPGPYTGIGSRQTPPDVLALMTVIARALAAQGFVLRSGGAVGADRAFELGSIARDIYIPFDGFNGYSSGRASTSPRSGSFFCSVRLPTPEAYVLAAKYHRAWARLSTAGQALIARNGHQVLGADLKTPARFVLCWTPDGATDRTTSKTGGTGQAVRVANAHGVKVWNLARGDHRKIWEACT